MSDNTDTTATDTEVTTEPVVNPTKATAPKVTRLTHPRSNQTIEVASNVGQYLANGWRVATVDAPKGNATLEDWQAFARHKGFTEDEIAGKTRDELRAALS